MKTQRPGSGAEGMLPAQGRNKAIGDMADGRAGGEAAIVPGMGVGTA